MAPFVLYLIIIVLLVCYICYRFATDQIPPFVLDRGGKKNKEEYFPDFEREDLKAYLKECEEKSIPRSLAKDFIIAIYNSMNWVKEPDAPKLAEDRYGKYDIDEEIDLVINHIFTKYSIRHIRWNDEEILSLVTFGDILCYLNKSIKTNT